MTTDEKKGTDLRSVAFYLPQFHPVPENDEWWGKGFTEWTNVGRAGPLFRGHRQPRVPADLGFYDLRLAESRIQQADLARAFGIDGFCYYHYWFEGRRLLERPFDEVLASKEPDFPFCLCWANQVWSRRWRGEERDVLMAQTYSPEDDERHAHWLCEAFADDRYLRVGDRALFLIYLPRDLPKPRKTIEVIRNVAMNAGLPEPFLVGVDSFCPWDDCRKFGFDMTLRFEPQLGRLPGAGSDGWSPLRFMRNLRRGVANGRLKVYDYADACRRMRTQRGDHSFIPSVFVNWDNTPRRGGDGIVIRNSTPELFRVGLERAETIARDAMPESPLVFINAWNEWAEGNYLEPDLLDGDAYLRAVRAWRSGS